jgi:hypothetical protein
LKQAQDVESKAQDQEHKMESKKWPKHLYVNVT